MSTPSNPTYHCPSCNCSEDLGFNVRAINFSILSSDGEWDGETILGDGDIVAVTCNNCGWLERCQSREEGLTFLKVIQPPLVVTYWGGLDKRFTA